MELTFYGGSDKTDPCVPWDTEEGQEKKKNQNNKKMISTQMSPASTPEKHFNPK